MSGHVRLLAALVALAIPGARATQPTAQGAAGPPLLHAADPARDYPVRPVPFTAVHLADEFWLPKIETNRQQTIPFAFQQCERTGRVDNFIRAAAALRGEP